MERDGLSDKTVNRWPAVVPAKMRADRWACAPLCVRQVPITQAQSGPEQIPMGQPGRAYRRRNNIFGGPGVQGCGYQIDHQRLRGAGTIDGARQDLLTGKTWTGALHFDADGVEMLQ
jgi:hypothetical protein